MKGPDLALIIFMVLVMGFGNIAITVTESDRVFEMCHVKALQQSGKD